METGRRRWVDKAGWGDGPWQREDDFVAMVDDATGLPCFLCRNDLGCWCGYVGLMEGHPWFEKPRGFVSALVDVHGGVSFSAGSVVEPGPDPEPGAEPTLSDEIARAAPAGRVWWIGFDCCHGGDKAPAFAALFDVSAPDLPEELAAMIPALRRLLQTSYRDQAYATAMVLFLAAQAAEAGGLAQ